MTKIFAFIFPITLFWALSVDVKGICDTAERICNDPVVYEVEENDYLEEKELIPCYATAYCVTGKTATGSYTRNGVCASTRDRFGKNIIVYQRLPDDSVGEIIGVYICEDTGGSTISSGKVIDIWKPNLSECHEFMKRVYEDGCRGKVYIQIIEGKG